MNTEFTRSLHRAAFVAALAVPAAMAAQPPDPTNSDALGNTAGGSGALLNLSSSSGGGNTAFGYEALYFNSTGSDNTAIGRYAMFDNGTGYGNTGVGSGALQNNQTGNYNIAIGLYSMSYNLDGGNNTASGYQALNANRHGFGNTAIGYQTLLKNAPSASGATDDGVDNTAVGDRAMSNNTTGYNNTGTGAFTLLSNTTGYYNTAAGVSALYANTTGKYNQASGVDALRYNTTGSYNTADGEGALRGVTTGSRNIGLGYRGGYSLTTGSYDIAIGNVGVAGETGVIRIGTAGQQTSTYVAGINGVSVSGGLAVYVNSAGQLGTVLSSARYKDDIRDMGEQSAKLAELRPVTFRYKADAKGERQYGLIAEEVDKVYPDLVVRGEQGEIVSVQYNQLIPMLVNELQKQQKLAIAQANELAALKADNAELRASLDAQKNDLLARLSRLEDQAGSSGKVASR